MINGAGWCSLRLQTIGVASLRRRISFMQRGYREDGEIDYYANYYAEYYGHYYTFYYGNYHSDVFTEEYFKKGRRSRLFMPYIVRRPENFAKGKHPGGPNFPVKVHKTGNAKDMQPEGPHADKGKGGGA